MSNPTRRRITESFAITFVLIVVFLGTAALGQYRQVDQGRVGTIPWIIRICSDTTGTQCVGTETTGTPGVYRLLTSTGGGGGGGTVAQGAAGGTAWLVSVSTMPPITGTVTANPAGTTTITGSITNSQTVGLITMPSLTFTSGTVLNTLTAGLTNTTTNSTLAIRCVDATGTAFVACGPTTVTASPTGTTTIAGTLTGVTGTVQANAGTGTFNTHETGTANVAFTNTAIQANAGTGTQNVTFTNTAIQANAGTGTLGVDLAKVLGGALSTANPIIDGGRVSTDTTASVANGGVVAAQLDKWGRMVITWAPQDLLGFGTANLTATTASQILASSGGANYKWAITSIMACNLSGVVATQLNVLDSSGTLMSFPWTQTATTAGESRCYMQQFPDPYLSAANSTISAQLTVSNATGVRVNITAHKTGT